MSEYILNPWVFFPVMGSAFVVFVLCLLFLYRTMLDQEKTIERLYDEKWNRGAKK